MSMSKEMERPDVERGEPLFRSERDISATEKAELLESLRDNVAFAGKIFEDPKYVAEEAADLAVLFPEGTKRILSTTKWETGGRGPQTPIEQVIASNDSSDLESDAALTELYFLLPEEDQGFRNGVNEIISELSGKLARDVDAFARSAAAARRVLGDALDAVPFDGKMFADAQAEIQNRIDERLNELKAGEEWEEYIQLAADRRTIFPKDEIPDLKESYVRESLRNNANSLRAKANLVRIER